MVMIKIKVKVEENPYGFLDLDLNLNLLSIVRQLLRLFRIRLEQVGGLE